MTHRRPKQIKKAYLMMKNPPVMVGIDLGTDNNRIEFVDSKELSGWQEEYGDRMKVSGTDWNKEIIVL